MAGEWIKIECSTPEKPEVVKIARILKRPRAHVFGCLVTIWAWFDRNSVDGVVDGMVSTDLDELSDMKGLCKAMSEVGWLFFDDHKQRVEIPNFSRHNGVSAKKRGLNSERQRRWRVTDVDAQALPERLPEKRRGQDISTPPTPLPGGRREKAASTPPRQQTCAYCESRHQGHVNGFKYCDKHFETAMQGISPREYQEPTIPTHAREEGASAKQEPQEDIPF